MPKTERNRQTKFFRKFVKKRDMFNFIASIPMLSYIYVNMYMCVSFKNSSWHFVYECN